MSCLSSVDAMFSLTIDGTFLSRLSDDAQVNIEKWHYQYLRNLAFSTVKTISCSCPIYRALEKRLMNQAATFLKRRRTETEPGSLCVRSLMDRNATFEGAYGD